MIARSKIRKLRTVLERALAELGSLLLELLDGTLVDTTALVDQVTSGGGLAGIDVTDDCKKQRDNERSSTRRVRLNATHRRR